MPVNEADLVKYTFDEYLDAWERDGQEIPALSRAFPAMDEIEDAGAHPDALDRIVSGPQFALIRTMDAIMADRWRDAVTLKENPIKDGSQQPAPIAIINDTGVRVLDKTAAPAHHIRFRDTIILQKSDDTFENYVEALMTVDGADAGTVSLSLRYKVIPAATLLVPASWQTPDTQNVAVSGADKVYKVQFGMNNENYQIGDVLIGEIYRNNDANDTITPIVGVSNIRVV